MPNIDIELTNRCNATCHFCPRDATPRQGIMTQEIFAKALKRVIECDVEIREKAARFTDVPIETVVRLCGLGEPLINPIAAECVKQVREAGFQCGLSSNAALLDEAKSQALLDAGLQKIYINVSDEGAAYDQLYSLPFQKTRDNVVRFLQMAEGRCEVYMCIVDHRHDQEHVKKLHKYWRGLGIKQFMDFDVINRGGALFVDEMQFESYPENQQAKDLLAKESPLPYCMAPFMFMFVGWDGNYYLCCSDWKKEVPVGHVSDASFMSVMPKKWQHVLSREPICKRCNHDPQNRLVSELRAQAIGQDGDPDKILKEIREEGRFRSVLGELRKTIEAG